jgi:hypothetical protein
MQGAKYAVVLAVCAAGGAVAQTPVPPKPLPRTLDGAAREKFVDPAKVREAAVRSLTEELKAFDPGSVTAKRVENRWQVWSNKGLLKDLGPDRAAALEAARTIQDLRVNQVGTVPGSSPAFEYWLVDGKPVRPSNGQLLVIPISPMMLRAEQVGGAWVVTDGLRGFYDFGSDGEAAQRAATVCWKYGFNRLGVIGSPRPAMTYLLLDPAAAERSKSSPLPPPSPLGVANDVTRTSLLLPGNVYGGAKKPINHQKLQIVKKDGEWFLAQDDEALARFGTSEMSARQALKALQDSKPNEVARLGTRGVPLFLHSGNPIHGEPLGVGHMSLNPDRVRVLKHRDAWWLFEGSRPVMEVGSKADAEVVLLAVHTFQLRSFSMIGRPEAGGMPFFTAGR